MAVEIQATRQRIIRRPRLTSMLDESTAKVRMLIAPAGYGKTTLARQWLGEPERRGVWYRGSPASADVAALAAGVAEASSEIIPNAGKRMRDRLRATGRPEDDVDILAELFAEDVQGWPEDAWLAIDDYHFAMESVASERFVDLLTQQTPIQLLLTSRGRPSWATARRIVYGEILEIDRRALAMGDDEARKVVGSASRAVLEVARGWPAVLGLVALTPDVAVGDATLPEKLYDFFAQELYSGLPQQYRSALAELSFAAHFDRSFALAALGGLGERTIEIGLSSGLLTEPRRHEFEIHPLLSELLQEKAFPTMDQRQTVAGRTGQILLETSRWDDAFDLATRFKIPDLLLSTLECALEPLLDRGRIATLGRWLDSAEALHLRSPLLDLAEAEVAFQSGDHLKAEALSAHAAVQLGRHKLASRAYARAGHGALFANREDRSVEHFRCAAETATNSRERREALYGLYMASSELGLPQAAEAMERFNELDAGDAPDDLLRGMVLRLIHAVRAGGIQEVLKSVEGEMHIPGKATNPSMAASFFHALAQALSLGGHYDRALEACGRLDELVKEHRLEFARPFAHINRAVALVGRRHFGRALKNLESARLALRGVGDAHVEGNLYAVHCRLLVATGRAQEAVAQREFNAANQPSGPLAAEVLTSRSLAFACCSETSSAAELLKQARVASTDSVAVRVMAPAIEAICARSTGRTEYARAAWASAVMTGNYDLLITAYRGHGPLLELLRRVADVNALSHVMGRAYDQGLARRWKIPIQRSSYSSLILTPRETEVINLVAAGSSNRHVAEALFISEATVKVHLRHIYERLDVRNRTEAVAKWLARPAE